MGTVAAEELTSHEPSRAVLHPDALVRSVRVGAHLKDNVHERSRLRDLPVDTRRAGSDRRLGEVDDEVAHAPEEVVLVHVPLRTPTAGNVRIRIWASNIQYHRTTAG